MSYILAQIFVCLLLAALLGLLIGWLMRGGCGKKIEQNDESWNHKIQALTQSNQIDLDERQDEQRVLRKNLLLEQERAHDLDTKYKLISQEKREITTAHTQKIKELEKEYDDKLRLMREEGSNIHEEKSKLEAELKAALKVKQELNSKLDDQMRIIKENDYKLKSLENKCELRVQALLSQKSEERKMHEKQIAILESKVSDFESLASGDKEKQAKKSESYEKKLAKLSKELSLAQSDIKISKNALAECQSEWAQKLREKEKKLKKLMKIAVEKDNLRLIKGIGKVLEKTLNSLGIYKFEQIASWGKDDIKSVNRLLSFTGRIEREKWVKQAKKLAAGEKTDFSKRVEKGEVPTSKG